MRVRSLLEAELFEPLFHRAPLAAQFSSLGLISGEWLTEFRTSFSAGCIQGGGPAASADTAHALLFFLFGACMECNRCSAVQWRPAGRVQKQTLVIWSVRRDERVNCP